MISNGMAALIAISSFILGTIFGFLLRHFYAKNKSVEAFRTLAAFIIIGLWALSVVADIFIDGYTANNMMYVLMSVVAGFFFGADVLEKTANRVLNK